MRLCNALLSSPAVSTPAAAAPRRSAPSLPEAALLGLLALAGGCSDTFFPLGSDEADSFRIVDNPNTRHLADALEGGDTLTFRDLFEQGEGLVFASRPDPFALLAATNTLDDNRAVAGRRALSVLSYNVAFLDINLLGFVPYARTPDLDERRRVLPGRVLSAGHDIVLLQEVWLDEDVAEFTRRGEALGYRAFLQPRADHNDGLLTMIKESSLAGGSTTRITYSEYGAQNGQEFFPGPGIKRGWLAVEFIHAELGPVVALNTHMLAYPENWYGRLHQARELGIVVEQSSNRVQAREGRAPLVFAGGDFNSGPYYKEARWESPDGSVFEGWFHNTLSYPTLLTYGDMVDVAIMGRPAADATADVLLGNTVVNNAATSATIPGAEEGFCARTPHTTFTATDCNSLYFDQYAGTEYPARLDHVFARDPANRIVATKSALVFTEKERFGALQREPSDHYGVLVEMLITP